MNKEYESVEEALSDALGFEVNDYEVFENEIYINETDMLSDNVTTNGRYELKVSPQLVQEMLKANSKEYLLKNMKIWKE